MPGSVSTVDQASGIFTTASKTLADTSVVQLVTTSIPCKRVKLLAPVNSSGAGTNVAPIKFGDSSNQDDWIATDGSRDQYVHVDNVNKIYVKGSANDIIKYRVE